MGDSQVLYEAVPSVIADGAEKTPLGDSVGRARVIVDGASPYTPPGQLRVSTGWAPLDYPAAFPNAIGVPGILEYVSMRTDPALDTAKDWYVLVFDAVANPAPGAEAVETFGPLVNDDFDYWEPIGGWDFAAGLLLVVSSTPVVYTAPVAPAGTDQFAYTIKYTPS